MTSGPGLVTLPPRAAHLTERIARAFRKAVAPPSPAGVIYLPVKAEPKYVRPVMRDEDARGLRIRGATWAETSLERCDFRGATLTDVRMNGADVKYCDFRGATLANVDLSRAVFEGARLDGVDLSRTDLRGADLRRMGGLTLTQVHAAITDDTTRLPGYLINEIQRLEAQMQYRTQVDLRDSAPAFELG